MPLKFDEDFSDLPGRAEFADGIAETVIFQLDELRQLTEQALDEFSGRHGLAVRAPEAGEANRDSD